MDLGNGDTQLLHLEKGLRKKKKHQSIVKHQEKNGTENNNQPATLD